MAEETVQPRDYYVYVLFREDGQTPFYIGMGRRDRWLQHEATAHLKRTHKNSVILNMRRNGFAVPKEKLAENLTRPEAVRLEIDLIRLIGRAPIGVLVNKTDGGEGQINMSEETRAILREKRKTYRHSPEAKEKIRAALLKRPDRHAPKSDEHKEKISKSLRGRVPTDEARANMRANASHHKNSPETLKKLRDSHLGRSLSPEHKAKISITLSGRKQPPELVERRASSNRGRKHTDKVIAKMRIAQSNRSADVRANISSAAKRGWVKRRQCHQKTVPDGNASTS